MTWFEDSWDYPILYCVHVCIYKDGEGTDVYGSNGTWEVVKTTTVVSYKINQRKLRNN